MFTRNKPYTNGLSTRVGGPTQLRLERLQPAVDLDDGPEEYAPPNRRELLQKLDDTLTELTPVERVKQGIRSLTYGEMIEVAARVAATLGCPVEKVAGALHEFGVIK